jgi:FixJ family two-component response regulator
MNQCATIFVIDADPQLRQSIAATARLTGLKSEGFDSAGAFLAAYSGEPGCLVTASSAGGMSSVALQQELKKRGFQPSVVVLLDKPNTAAVVQSMKHGATTVLDNPCDDNELWQAIRQALAEDADRSALIAQRTAVQDRLRTLTASERTVLDMIIAGNPNKTIASQLGASLRTIESRRRGVFTKLGVQSVAELVAAVMKAEEASA